MKNDTIKSTDKIVMARYVSGVSSSQKDKDGIFAEAEQIYDHGFRYNNVSKEDNKAILYPETKTDGLDQSTINWALKKAIHNVSLAVGDLDRTLNNNISDLYREVMSIELNIPSTSTINSRIDHIETEVRDNYDRIDSLENRINNISQSGVLLCNITTVNYEGEQEEIVIDPSTYFRVHPSKFIADAPAIFRINPMPGYVFNPAEPWNTEDGPELVYAANGQTISENYQWINVTEDEAYLYFDKTPSTHINIVDPYEDHYEYKDSAWITKRPNGALNRNIPIVCEIPHVYLSRYFVSESELGNNSTIEFYAYCNSGYKFNTNTFNVVGNTLNNVRFSDVADFEFNEYENVCKITLNFRKQYLKPNSQTKYTALNYICIGSVVKYDNNILDEEQTPAETYTVTLSLSNVSNLNVSNDMTTQTPKTKTVTYELSSNSTLHVPLYKYKNTGDFQYSIDGNPVGGPNHIPGVIVNNSNFYYELTEDALILHITSIWGDCDFSVYANYVDDETIPSEPTDENNDPVNDPTLRVSPDEISLVYNDLTPKTVTVTSNSNFTIK